MSTLKNILMAGYNFSKPAISALKNILMAEYNFAKPAIF
jgi:hypothetical protein